MKNSLVTWSLSFFFLVSCYHSMYASPVTDSSRCVEIDGLIENANIKNTECLIELVCSNTVVESVVLKNGKKKFTLHLKKNAFYTIKISKKGYITRLICVDTKISRGYYEKYSFSFETKLPDEAEAEKLNKDYLDFPIALIYFDVRKDCFVFDKEYTSRLKKEIAVN
jgi:hypothetical protein